jgi:excinuclease ABC subunit A
MQAASQAQTSAAEAADLPDLDYLSVRGARVHNLRNLSVDLPRNRMVVITGISGSGKSSLAFDTIYAEGQRRYMESLSAYARQFIGSMERPDVDNITGLSPVISIEQKTTSRNPRSTVGTVTEIYDFMRLLFARASEAWSYKSGKKMVRYTEEQILHSVLERFGGRPVLLLAPLVRGRKGHYRELFEQVRRQGFVKARVDGEIRDIEAKMQVDRYKVHDIDVVVDQLYARPEDERRLQRSLSTAMSLGKGTVGVQDRDKPKNYQVYSRQLMCPDTGLSYEEPSPNTFSFNSPYGACPTCKGLGELHTVDREAVLPDPSLSIEQGGIAPLGEWRDNYLFEQIKALSRKYKFKLNVPVGELPPSVLQLLLEGSNAEGQQVGDGEDPSRWYTLANGGVFGLVDFSYRNTSSEAMRRWAEGFMQRQTCPDCQGSRLKMESLWFRVDGRHIAELSAMDLRSLSYWLETVEERLSDRQQQISRDVFKEIRDRVGFLLNVGLDYLSLDRPARTLSGGESQRIRLATQIGSKLTGITYILDEPSIGLHQRDNQRLISALRDLASGDNTVLVVEHDRDIMLASDHIIDLGPGAGVHGGQLVAEGPPGRLLQSGSLTARYLSGELGIPVPAERRTGSGKALVLKGAAGNNLHKVEVRFPLGVLTVVTGVSGSGKSTLINETLFPLLHNNVYKTSRPVLEHRSIKGLEHIDKVIEIDQSPIGRTPRSNPATYIGVFTEIRDLFARMPEAKIRGYKPGRFSFNVKAGRCDKCEGAGVQTIEMNFLPDVYVLCDRCLGKRYQRETLEVLYKGKSIADVLDMTVDDGVEFFEAIPRIYRKLKTLQEVGLGYIHIGQSSTTLSGGEAQRVKLASELSKRDTGSTFYILDEPTTGLHFEDVRILLGVLQRLVDRGNTVLVIEHNMDVIKVADYLIDLGPEGGSGGGRIIASGTPEEVAQVEASHTGRFLRPELGLG